MKREAGGPLITDCIVLLCSEQNSGKWLTYDGVFVVVKRNRVLSDRLELCKLSRSNRTMGEWSKLSRAWQSNARFLMRTHIVRWTFVRQVWTKMGRDDGTKWNLAWVIRIDDYNSWLIRINFFPSRGCFLLEMNVLQLSILWKRLRLLSLFEFISNQNVWKILVRLEHSSNSQKCENKFSTIFGNFARNRTVNIPKVHLRLLWTIVPGNKWIWFILYNISQHKPEINSVKLHRTIPFMTEGFFTIYAYVPGCHGVDS